MTETTEVRTFDTVSTNKLNAALRKMFNEQKDELVSESELLEAEQVAIIDNAHVMLVEALSTEARLLLRPYIEPESFRAQKPPGWAKVPTFGEDPRDGPAVCHYSSEYMARIFDLMNRFPDEGYHRIEARTDYPLIVENEHVRIMLAPRIVDA